MKKINILAACLVGAVSAQAFEVENVTAHQRWPWNNLVDVDYEITGAAEGEAFAIDIKAEWAGGSKKAVATSFVTEPIGVCGVNRITWNFGEDCPNVVAEDLRVSVTATPFSEKAAVYMVVDISSGKDSTKYPVRYTTTPPAHVRGAGNEPCQTTEIWLRRIPARGRTFYLNGYSTSGRVYAQQKNDYYMSIFEVTQKQWLQVRGDVNFSYYTKFTNPDYAHSRPMDYMIPSDILGDWNWPDAKDPVASSFVDRMRSRTGLATINMPTDAQWQFAVSAGPMTTETSAYGELADIARYKDNCIAPSAETAATCGVDTGTAYVGSYLPNDFGLYDMLGNVMEYVLDPYMTVTNLKNYYTGLGLGTDADHLVLESIGVPGDVARNQTGLVRTHVLSHLRGENYLAAGPSYWSRTYSGYTDRGWGRGFRLAVTCEK